MLTGETSVFCGKGVAAFLTEISGLEDIESVFPMQLLSLCPFVLFFCGVCRVQAAAGSGIRAPGIQNSSFVQFVEPIGIFGGGVVCMRVCMVCFFALSKSFLFVADKEKKFKVPAARGKLFLGKLSLFLCFRGSDLHSELFI